MLLELLRQVGKPTGILGKAPIVLKILLAQNQFNRSLQLRPVPLQRRSRQPLANLLPISGP